MFLYEKKIVYLSMYVDGVKEASAGFIRISRERDSYLLDIHIKQMTDLTELSYPLFLIFRDKKVELTVLSVQGGEINAVRSFPVRQEVIHIDGQELKEKDLCGVALLMDRRHEIRGCWQEPECIEKAAEEKGLLAAAMDERKKISDSQSSSESRDDSHSRSVNEGRDSNHSGSVNEGRNSAHSGSVNESRGGLRNRRTNEGRDSYGSWNMHESREIPEIRKTGWSGKVVVEDASEDKWEQLQKSYKQVHPFGDERLFLTIEPKDFIILQAPFQRLVNNSFLLHGFYNYRHLILGPDKEIGNGDGSCFYLGVPGTYFEREKMVAVMFGFEGFECSGPVEIGKFGYYMRRVEI